MAMDATSLGNISIPVSLMAGDADVTVPVDTNVRRVAKMLPKADLLLVPGASHYTFMDTCLPGPHPMCRCCARTTRASTVMRCMPRPCAGR